MAIRICVGEDTMFQILKNILKLFRHNGLYLNTKVEYFGFKFYPKEFIQPNVTNIVALQASLKHNVYEVRQVFDV